MTVDDRHLALTVGSHRNAEGEHCANRRTQETAAIMFCATGTLYNNHFRSLPNRKIGWINIDTETLEIE